MPRTFENSIQIPVGQVAGYVLTSDSSGVASWQLAPVAPAFVLDGGSSTTTPSGQARIDCGGSV